MTTRDLAWRKPGEFSLASCEACNLIMTTPRPTSDCMPRYYEDWYSYKDIEAVRHESTHSPSNRYIAWVRLKILEKSGSLKPGMRVLDVGAGFGVQLNYYIQQRNVVGTALDMDPTTTQHSLVKDIAEVRTGDLLEAEFESESFDLVTFYETLEHVHRPIATLKEAFRILKPGGRLVVEVPDYGSALRRLFGRYWFPIMVPVHLHHFTKDSLRRVVAAAGLQPVRHVSMFVPFETTGSLLLAYCALTGAHMYDVSRVEHVLKRKPIHLPFFGFLVAWTLCFDFSIQSLVWLLRRSGAQALIGVKPARQTADGGTEPR
jgi:SAM-dependent methyltransferase